MIKLSNLLIVLLLTLTSCSYFGGEPSRKELSNAFTSEEFTQEDPQISTIPVEKLPEKGDTTLLDKVEVLWNVPEEPADGFILHYGYAPQALTNTLRLKTTDIEKINDAEYGAVYRHVITELPPEKTVFISLQTINGDEISDRSDVFEVKP